MNLFFGWLLLFVPLVAISPRKLSVLEWIWFLFFGWLALFGQRYVIWFIFILTILTCSLLAEWGRLRLDKPGGKRLPALDISLGILFAIMPIALLPGIRETWWTRAPETLTNTPVEAAKWLSQNPDIPGPLWSEIGFSSYLEYALPSRLVWNDTRFEVYPAKQWERCQAIDQAKWNWQILLDEEGINLLMISKVNQEDLLEAVRHSPSWIEVYQDEVAAIFKRRMGD
jgi:hypothetical protein